MVLPWPSWGWYINTHSQYIPNFVQNSTVWPLTQTITLLLNSNIRNFVFFSTRHTRSNCTWRRWHHWNNKRALCWELWYFCISILCIKLISHLNELESFVFIRGKLHKYDILFYAYLLYFKWESSVICVAKYVFFSWIICLGSAMHI